MRIFGVLVAILAVFLIAGCADKYELTKDSDEIARDDWFKGLIQQYKKRVNDNGLLEIEVVLLSDEARTLAYKIDWLDKDGFSLRNAIDEQYQTITLPENQEVILRKLPTIKGLKILDLK